MTHRDSVAKRILFTLITLLLAALLIVGAEYSLRLLGYGTSYPLFVDYKPVTEYRVANPEIIRRYLGKKYRNPHKLKINPVYFLSKKPGNMYRIAVQGSSPAAGYPYGFFASLARQLERRLHRSYAGHFFEVVDTSITAVNSYVLRDLADEIIDIKPDAVVIYAGNNEYLGIMGVGSTMGFAARVPPQWSHFANLLFLRLKDLRLFQLIQDIYSLLSASKDIRQDNALPRSLMATIAREQNIVFGSQLYQLGLEQFESNLAAILKKYKKAGIRVYIGTVVTNIHGLPPFSSKPGDGVDTEHWQAIDKKALTAFQEQNYTSATNLLKENIASDPLNASAWFKLGRIYEAQERYDTAYDAYIKAKDFDQLRFRAPDAINSIIRRLADRYGATVVEVGKHFRAHAPHGLVGNELMAEHVHFNPFGYFLIADSFFTSMVDNHAFGKRQKDGPAELRFAESPITKVDEHLGTYIMERLKSDFPFRASKEKIKKRMPHTFEEILATQIYEGRITLTEATEKQWEHYRKIGDVTNATKILLNYATFFPYKARIQYMAGTQLMLLHRTAEALPYLYRAIRHNSDNLDYLLQLGEALLKTQRYQEAGKIINRTMMIAPENEAVQQLSAQLNAAGKG